MEQAKPAAVASNKKVVLREYISRAPREDDMVLVDGDTVALCVPEGAAGPAVLVKNLYLSCDPYMRGRMQDFHDSYIPPFKPGSVIEGFGVARVVDSTHPGFGAGDIVSGLTGWEEYSLLDKPEQLRKIQQSDIPLSYHLGLLGMPGFTAYVGFYEVCSPKKGEFVFVSAASGAVGQIVGQLAKLHGCYVVGSAGTDQKVELLKDKLRFDAAFNYKGEADEAPDTVTGDIVFVLHQKDHSKFKRKGDDLFYEHTLSLTEALCGFQFVLTHMDNRQLLIKSNPGEVVKPDQFKAINDLGMPMYQRPFMKRKLYIHFTVEFPDSLAPEKCKALEAVLSTKAFIPADRHGDR